MAQERKEILLNPPTKIAFINDDIDSAETIAEILETNGYQVEHFPDFESFFKMLERNPNAITTYALFLADYELDDDPLSKIRGDTGTRRIMELCPRAKVLGLSGRKSTKESFIESGAIGFIHTRDGSGAILKTMAKVLEV